METGDFATQFEKHCASETSEICAKYTEQTDEIYGPIWQMFCIFKV